MAIRVKAGTITLNLARQGLPFGTTVLDDRPGETAYFKFRMGELMLTELQESEAMKLMRKTKPGEVLETPLPNNEEIRALLNLSIPGSDLMRPATQRRAPDGDNALITVFRRGDGDILDLGIWSEDRFLGILKVKQGLEVLVPAGTHFFLAGYVGTSLLQAEVEVGKRYYAWLDVGSLVYSVRLTPVTRQQSDNLVYCPIQIIFMIE